MVAFVAEPASAQYCRPADDAAMAAIIARAHGTRGSNRDYVLNTWRHLRELGIADRGLARVVARLETQS